MIEYLPMNRKECLRLGWKELDIIIVTGDAYVDHHSFGTAIIGRFLAANGFKIGIIAQPDWRTDRDFLALGKPRLFFGVTAGNIDSMLNHYTAQKKIRSNDDYSPNGKAGLRPDRATIVYTQKLKQLFKNTPVIIGGIEASMRRIAHYDYWQDKIRNSILFDSKANLLVYGMAEKTILEIADRRKSGEDIKEITDILGTVVSSAKKDPQGLELPDFGEVTSRGGFLQMTRFFLSHYQTNTIYQRFGHRYLQHNPPQAPLTTKEIDFIYNLSFSRKPHPSYKGKNIPAYEQIKESITSHRGCSGGCNFCTIGFHQGKKIQSRSKKSIVKEITALAEKDFFRGTITDIGGPSANMYGMSCSVGYCNKTSCLQPDICPQLNISHKKYKELLNRCLEIPSVNHVFIASGIRTDLAVKDEEFMKMLAAHHTGGRIKVAPEHVNSKVLKMMNKQDFSTYKGFCRKFIHYSKKQNKKYSVIPYFMVGHPGTTLDDAVELGVYLKKYNLKVDQVQEFTPTPMSISTAMYYTGKDIKTGKVVYVPKGREIKLQKALVRWFDPQNKKYIIEALKKTNRSKLIPFFFDH